MPSREVQPHDRVRLNAQYGNREVVIAEVHKNSVVTTNREWLGKHSIEALLPREVEQDQLAEHRARDKDLRWELAIEAHEQAGGTDDGFYALPYLIKQDLLNQAQKRLESMQARDRALLAQRWGARQ